MPVVTRRTAIAGLAAGCGRPDLAAVPFHFTLVDNIERDPFEQAVGLSQKIAMSIGRHSLHL
jgi:hypothetical protein